MSVRIEAAAYCDGASPGGLACWAVCVAEALEEVLAMMDTRGWETTSDGAHYCPVHRLTHQPRRAA